MLAYFNNLSSFLCVKLNIQVHISPVHCASLLDTPALQGFLWAVQKSLGPLPLLLLLQKKMYSNIKAAV